MNFTWANELAKNALKTAQKKIDDVLDIRPEDIPDAENASVVEDELITSIPRNYDVETSPQTSSSTAVQDSDWGSTWGSVPVENELIVTEPNPIRDADGEMSCLVDNSHSPSSNSPDADQGLNETYAAPACDKDSDEDFKCESASPIRNEPLLPPHAGSRRGSHQEHDDSLTVASSDIEIIRQADAWSIASSRIADVQNMPLHFKGDEAVQAHLAHSNQRIKELKAQNDNLHHQNTQLQQRVSKINQEYNSVSKELQSKTQELEDLRVEARQMSDYSAKQSREIRRLKEQLKEHEKIVSDRKKLREEKTYLEEHIYQMEQDAKTFSANCKDLQATVDQLRKDCEKATANAEAAQKQLDQQLNLQESANSHIADHIAEREKLTEDHKNMSLQLEEAQSLLLAKHLEAERAHEAASAASDELKEARLQISRLSEQLVMQSHSSQLDNSQMTSVISISAANDALMYEINDLRCELTSAIQTVNKLEEDVQFHKNQASQIREELEKERSERQYEQRVRSKEAERVRKELDLALEQKDVQRVEAERVWRSRSDKNHDECERLRHIEESLRQQVTLLQDRNLDYEHQISQLKAQLCDISKANAAFSDEERNAKKINTSAVLNDDFGRSEHDTVSTTQFENMLYKCSALEEEVRNLKIKLDDVTSQYSVLLELDGERLEKIEEQEHDIIDLRHLLHTQALALTEKQDIS